MFCLFERARHTFFVYRVDFRLAGSSWL